MQLGTFLRSSKNQTNIEQRGLSYDEVTSFEIDTALIWQDTRKIYPEIRYSSLGLLNGQLYALVLTETQQGIRVISFRKANRKEVKRYEQAINPRQS